MHITYRKASPEDAAALLAYFRQVGGESDNLTFGSAGVPVSAEREAAFLAEQEKRTDSLCLLALDGGQIVGNAVLDGLNRSRFSHRATVAITVRKSHWGQGIGTELMGRLIDFAKSAGTEILSLEVRSDNARAIALYRKFGFQRFGTFRGFFKLDDRYYDADFMTLHLH